MNFKEKARKLYKRLDDKFVEQFGFRMKELSFTKIVLYLYQPKDSSSLAVTRILFGLCMLLDVPDERGGANMDARWENPQRCHFPLFPFLTALPMPYMAMVYAGVWFGALGIMLGYQYRVTSLLFTTCYWYLLLIEKSFWNNHSYLFGLLGLLMTCSSADCYWSIDAYQNPALKSYTVPYWNYFVVKYQVFILYFVAGLKKATPEWLSGYSVQKLADHWLFDAFKWFLTVKQIDYFIVHWYIFVFDLTVAIWMMWAPTRSVAMLLCAMFHLMNSRLFTIGMFPWVCLATMPLFYPFDWPKRVLLNIQALFQFDGKIICTCNGQIDYLGDDEESCSDEEMPTLIDTYEYQANLVYDENLDEFDQENSFKIETNATNNAGQTTRECKELAKDKSANNDLGVRKKLTTIAIIIFVFVQAFLPFSHFITKGYNNWTQGLYGYSWDMMVHSWDSSPFVVKLVDNDNGEENYLDPLYYTVNDRWTRHGDMVYQYAHCLKHLIRDQAKAVGSPKLFTNISIYVDIWYSLNGRFTQRMFDSKQDILTASWSPFQPIPFLMPLLDEALHWRSVISEIREEIEAWSNGTELVFYADFPGYDQEKFISRELKNVTLTILEGTVGFQTEQTWQSYLLFSGDRVEIQSGAFHSVKNIGTQPAYYVYKFTNSTAIDIGSVTKPKLPIAKELYARFEKMHKFVNLVFRHIFLCFSNYRCS